jgi:hypothetical protein
VVEMTKGRKEPADIVRQIQSGAETIQARGLSAIVGGDLLPLYLEGRGRGHVATRTALRHQAHQIPFDDRVVPIFTAACGATLSSIFDEMDDIGAGAATRSRARRRP